MVYNKRANMTAHNKEIKPIDELFYFLFVTLSNVI